MPHQGIGLRRALSVALLATVIVFGTAASAFALSSIQGDVSEWGTNTGIAGIRVEVFDADTLWDTGDRLVLGTAVTDALGDYTVSNLPNDTGVVIAYEELTGAYRDITYFYGGLPLEYSAAWLTPVDDTLTDVKVMMRPLNDLAANRAARIGGTDRYATSALISSYYFGATDTVIIASGAGFADALAAAPLAGAYNAPVLLTKPTTLPAVIGDEVERLGATQAFIIGSTTAVSDAVKTQLMARGITSVTRLGGANRYATAEKVIYALPADYFNENTISFVCRGDNFADALAVSPIAAAQGYPILLTGTTKLPAETARAWHWMVDRGCNWAVAIGSEAAVSEGIGSALDSYVPDPGLYWDRLDGANRYETAATVAEAFGPWDFIGLANGANYPDALSGGAALGAWGGTLALTTPTGLHYAAEYTLDNSAPYVMSLGCFGSTAAVSTGTFNAAIDTLGTDFYDIDDPDGYITVTGVSSLSVFLDAKPGISVADAAGTAPAATATVRRAPDVKRELFAR